MDGIRLDWFDLVTRLLFATSAGMVIGLDREWRSKLAGIRTHMLVSLGSAVAMIVAVQMDNPSNVVQGIVTGIGFIGTGAILHHSRHVEGVTTAASAWVCGMIGIAAGAAHYFLAAVAGGLVIFTLAAVNRLSKGQDDH
jgi:putative Mg2+ transporter-C (MgtC) family protein